ncbi:hypothetical protein [Botrimarina mediterranea]|uniref:hypothetical protein n=1 Tax=Botrimarina mediterranea TaxID=2528022 RepID=UPI0011A933E8
MAVLLGDVSAAVAQLTAPFDPSHESSTIPAPLAPPVTTPPVASVDPETGEVTDGRPPLREWTAFEEFGIVTQYLVRFVQWLMNPVCMLLEIIFDWLGFFDVIPVVSFTGGVIGWIGGIVDAWLPLHEFLAHAVTLSLVYILWAPFRVLIVYLVPGLG